MKKLKLEISHFLNSKKGFSLVEIVVSMGLLGLVGVGITNLSRVGGDQSKALKQSVVVESAIGRLSRVLSRADTCDAFGNIISTAEVQGIVAPVLDSGVTVTNVVQQNFEATPLALLPVNESTTVAVQLLVTFTKETMNGPRPVNRIAYARHVYENTGAGAQFVRCANYESDNARSAFEANCRTIGGTFTLSNVTVEPWSGNAAAAPLGKRYWCDLSSIDNTRYFSDILRKEVCERLYGSVNSYNNISEKCRDLIVTGNMTAINVDPTRIGLDDGAGGYNYRTTFDQNACVALGDPNAFITGVNIDGTVECNTLEYCVLGSPGCGTWTDGSGLNHCSTDCGCATTTQADASENDFGDTDGDGDVRTCRPVLTGECAATRTEAGGGQYDEGAGTDYLTYKCYGLDCDFKDYFEVTAGDPSTDNTYESSLSIGLYSTNDLTASNQLTSCGTPTLEASRSAGVCAIFSPASMTALSTYPQGNNSVPDANGLNITLVDGKLYGTTNDSCNGGLGVCRNGGTGASGTGTSSSEGSCCSAEFDYQPGSGDQCGNPMRDDCSNIWTTGDTAEQRYSIQCTSSGLDGSPNFCEINGNNLGNSGYTTTVPSGSANCCQQNYACGTNPASYSSCQAAGSTFSYCADATETCSREHPSAECCKASYSCAETVSSECINYAGSTQVTCGGSTPVCIGSGPTSSCVQCSSSTNCASNEYCSGNSCLADVCIQGSEVDTDSRSCTPTAVEASCDTANGELPLSNSGTETRTRTCNADGSGFGSWSSWSSTCSGGTCYCSATLPAASTVACGSSVSNCAGTVNGTQCSSGFTCNAGSCDPIANYNWTLVKVCDSTNNACTGGNCSDPAQCSDPYLEQNVSVGDSCPSQLISVKNSAGWGTNRFAILRCQ